MDLKKVDELLRMKGNCAAAVDTLTIELLSVIANNTSRIVQLLENQASGQQELALGNPNSPKVYAKDVLKTKKEFTEEVKEKVEEAIDEEVKKPVAKKAAPKKVEEPKQEAKPAPKKEEPKAEPQAELPTKEEVMEKLVAFIQANGEPALAEVFKELGGYANFPAIPQDKYPELLTKIV